MFVCQPSLAQERDRTGKTALHYCAEQAGPASAAPLLQVAPQLLDAKDQDGYCTLTLAVIAGNRALVRYLLARGADVDALDNEKHSVVHWATGKGRPLGDGPWEGAAAGPAPHAPDASLCRQVLHCAGDGRSRAVSAANLQTGKLMGSSRRHSRCSRHDRGAARRGVACIQPRQAGCPTRRAAVPSPS